MRDAGVRLYFSHQRRGYGYYPVSNQLSALELCHVRPPPTPAAPQPILPAQIYNQQVQVVAPAPAAHATAFNSIIQARYSSGGLFLASNNLADDLDVLLLAAPDVASAARAIAEGSSNASTVGSTTRPYAEVAGTIDISGRTWAMAEITPISLVQAVGGTALNELATQATQPRRRWVVLTNMGANVVVRQRPVDTLREVLEGINASGNGAHGEVGVFFESYVPFISSSKWY
jgi:nuclear pore complex protein Nup155